MYRATCAHDGEDKRGSTLAYMVTYIHTHTHTHTHTGITIASLLCAFPLLGKLDHIIPLLKAQSLTSSQGSIAGQTHTHTHTQGEDDDDDDDLEEEEEEQGIELLETGGHIHTHPPTHTHAHTPELTTIVTGEELPQPLLPQDTHLPTETHTPSEHTHTHTHTPPRRSSCLHSTYLYFEALLSPQFFLITLSILCFYLAFIPFETFAVDFLKVCMCVCVCVCVCVNVWVGGCVCLVYTTEIILTTYSPTQPKTNTRTTSNTPPPPPPAVPPSSPPPPSSSAPSSASSSTKNSGKKANPPTNSICVYAPPAPHNAGPSSSHVSGLSSRHGGLTSGCGGLGVCLLPMLWHVRRCGRWCLSL